MEEAGRLAAALEEAAAAREALRSGEQMRIVSSDMLDQAHKTAISAGQRRAAGGDDAFGRAINAAGYSVRSLAAALGVSQALVHAHRKAKGEANSRPIPRERAEQIEQLTKWPADARHWPCGIAS